MAEQTPGQNAPLVLLVDADEGERLSLAALLQGSGFQVAGAVDAVAGLRQAVQLRPAVVVLDARLPGGDADVVLRRLQALPQLAGVPVVIMERRRLPAGIERAARCGAVYLPKPFRPEELVDAVRAALGLEEHEAVGGAGPAESPRLGEVLKDMGAITDEQLERALSSQPRLGQILEELGMVTRAQIDAALARQAEMAAAAGPAEVVHAGKVVLIVDDDEDLLAVLAAALRRVGLEVMVATDAVSATSTAMKQPPDVVLMDVGLPGGDGVTVMQRLHALPRLAGVPVVVLSGRDPQQHRERAIQAGAVGYLEKPVQTDDLVAALRAALDGPAAKV